MADSRGSVEFVPVTLGRSRSRGEPSDGHDLRMDWDFDGEEFDEESKLREETRKIMELPDLPVSATCVRVPVMVGHSIAVRATFEREPDLGAAHEALEAFPNLVVADAPTPLEFAGRDEVAVGRVRRDLGDASALNLFVVGDNLLKGAALNTVQIAEELVARGHA